jgi:site-specific DNA recombinase
MIMKEPVKYKVGIYCRLSKDDGSCDESLSVRNQKELLQNYAINQDWFIYDVYIDDGYTGTNFNRPGFQRMISDIEHDYVNLVLVKDLSRLGRNYILCGQYTEIYFPEKGVRFVAIHDGIDSKNTDQTIMPFKHVLNDMYCRDISLKMRSVLKQKISKGEYIGKHAPTGYMKNPKNKRQLVVDEATAPIVRRIFDLSLSGLGSHAIATILNKEHILTPEDHARFQKNKDADFISEKQWLAGSVRRILKNEIYTGKLMQGKTRKISYKSKKIIYLPREEFSVIENAHDPIISKDLFNKVQEILSGRKFLCEPINSISPIFSGLFYCGDCGHEMRMANNTSKGVYFICKRSSERGAQACSSHYISYKALAELVLEDLNRSITIFRTDEKQAIEKLKSAKQAKNQGYLENIKKEIKKSAERRSELELLMRCMYEDNLAGKLSDALLSVFIKNYTHEQQELDANLKVLHQQQSDYEQQHQDIQSFVDLISNYMQLNTLNRQLLEQLIERIEIYETGINGKREKIIKIIYKFIGVLSNC